MRQLVVRDFQRTVAGTQIMQLDMAGKGQRADVFKRHAAHLQPVLAEGAHLGSTLHQQSGELGRLRRAHGDDLLGEFLDQLQGGCFGDQLSAADEDQLLRHLLHLAHQVAGDEDGPAGICTSTHQLPDPGDAVRVQPVHGLVQDEDLRVSQQGGGDPQALAHAQGESSNAFAGHGCQPDFGERFVHSAHWNSIALRQGF